MIFENGRVGYIDYRRRTMIKNGRNRVVIQNVNPEIDCGQYPIKRVVGEKVVVEADIFGDGHDSVSAVLLYKKEGDRKWNEAPMDFLVNDRWRGEFDIEELTNYVYSVEGWVDHFKTWVGDIKKKFEAQQDISVDLLIGAKEVELAIRKARGEDRDKLKEFHSVVRNTENPHNAVALVGNAEFIQIMKRYPDRSLSSTYHKDLRVHVDRSKALFSAWYERFPRSCAPEENKHGTFKDLETLLPEISRMGFDVLYLPPIHPIGKINRKGKNNSVVCKPDEPGSPWAIGSDEGGHTSIHPELGTMKDFLHLVRKTEEYGMEIALDLAYQCTPDHPYVKEHPEWFRKRPDGSIQYAENPPKKYQDIYPINFESEDWKALWEELKSIVEFWLEKGVRIFRVDNPHTKAFAFWEWMLNDLRKKYPDSIFLSEAFTRPKVMYKLAKIGFNQSYTYFTWRNSKQEFTDYITELTKSEVKEYFRPNFWPNTPDILPQHLQYDGRQEFIKRLVLAATLSSNYGIYGPAFELCIQDAVSGKEEYLNSEKYEIKRWNWNAPGNLKDIIRRVNTIRKENTALHFTNNIDFCDIANDMIMSYLKVSGDGSNIILVVINMDPHHTQSGWVQVPIQRLGIPAEEPYMVHDLLGDAKYIWRGGSNYVELNPHILPAHIFRIHGRLRKETDFDYFM
jgi:starch synthase (maltosyl-transferring)